VLCGVEDMRGAQDGAGASGGLLLVALRLPDPGQGSDSVSDGP